MRSAVGPLFLLCVLCSAACGAPPWEDASPALGRYAGQEAATTRRSGENTHTRGRREVTLSRVDGESGYHVDVGPCLSVPLKRIGPQSLEFQGELVCESSLLGPGGSVTVRHRVTRVVAREGPKRALIMEGTWERLAAGGDVDPTQWEFEGDRVAAP